MKCTEVQKTTKEMQQMAVTFTLCKENKNSL